MEQHQDARGAAEVVDAGDGFLAAVAALIQMNGVGDEVGGLVRDRLVIEIRGEFWFQGFDSFRGEGHEAHEVCAVGLEFGDLRVDKRARDGDVYAAWAGPGDLAGEGAVGEGEVAEEGEDAKIGVGDGHVGPEDHLLQVRRERFRLESGGVEVEVLAHAGDVHVVQDASLAV